jgi:hypothetical protein
MLQDLRASSGEFTLVESTFSAGATWLRLWTQMRGLVGSSQCDEDDGREPDWDYVEFLAEKVFLRKTR